MTTEIEILPKNCFNRVVYIDDYSIKQGIQNSLIKKGLVNYIGKEVNGKYYDYDIGIYNDKIVYQLNIKGLTNEFKIKIENNILNYIIKGYNVEDIVYYINTFDNYTYYNDQEWFDIYELLSDYLIKPINKEQLKKNIGKQINRRVITIEEIKEIDFLSIFDKLGIQYKKHGRICNLDGSDGWIYSEYKNIVNDFSRDRATGNQYNFVKKYLNLSNSEVYEWFAQEFNL